MAILKVYEYPHPVLKIKCEKVEKVDEEIRQLLDDMLETMYDAVGVGLAAPQIGVSKRIMVIDESHDDEKKTPLFMINPEIIEKSQDCILGEEGCLSVPDMRADVERFAEIKVKYLDYHGEEKILNADDFLAIVIQHEIDHLDGLLYIDRISRLKRQMLLKKLEKARKEQMEEY